MKKILPKIMNDEEAESLLAADLSEYLIPENFKANFTPVFFEFTPKEKTIPEVNVVIKR
jgi:predicted DNA binding CopG/RHH family protein